MLISISQLLNFLTTFRLLDIQTGSILGSFLELFGGATQMKTRLDPDYIVLNENGYKGKLSLYKIPLTFLDVLSYRVIIYLISWFLKLVSFILLSHMKYRNKIYPGRAYFVYY